MKMKITDAVQILAFIVEFLLIFYVAEGNPNTTVVYIICNSIIDPGANSFELNTLRVLDDLERNTSSPGHNYYTASPDGDGTKCYGYTNCNSDLLKQDCHTCMANRFILNECFLSIGVQFQLKDCRVRYEQYPFTE